MEEAVWLFGPPGLLLPVPAPEPELTAQVSRFGGIHTGIGGGRTVDIIGYRKDYEITLEYIEPDEFYALEALFLGHIPGPFWLLDPMRKNLFSNQTARCAVALTDEPGVRSSGSALNTLRSYDFPVSWNQLAANWSNLSTASRLTFDQNTRLPVVPDEDVTASVYVRPTFACSLKLNIVYYRRGVQISTVDGAVVACGANTVTRLASSFTPPGNADEFYIQIIPTSLPTAGTAVKLSMPQVEHSGSASDFSVGGAAALVAFETFENTSPRYPYRSATLKLLEV